MNKTDQVELSIEVSATDARAEDIDYMTRQLLAELRELDVESVELTKGGSAPKGSKGDPVTIGAIALVVLPAVLPKVVDLVQGWSRRGQGRSVKFKGMGIEFEGSLEDLREFLATYEKGKKKK